LIGIRAFKLVAWLVILSGFAQQTSADELGRLFFSAEERRLLDQKRTTPSQVSSKESMPKLKTESTAKLEPAESVLLAPPTITGRVIRSSGNNTIWFNETPNYRRNSTNRQHQD
jgi:hypothetical protein